ncbi:hypothetical protein [Kribbella catacumbae]|uniref:hypothetical protein n=1 Tax=Kribbella catacumbae TaxID=460086 RepID=UPI000399FA2D|nr:hypothetical protein [Kribbella catacumbae]
MAAAGVGASLTSPVQAQDAELALHSKLVYPGADGKLNYAAEPKSGKKIPNFSWAGYRNGEVPIPTVPTVKTIGPIAGETDATARINAALAEVAAMPMDRTVLSARSSWIRACTRSPGPWP